MGYRPRHQRRDPRTAEHELFDGLRKYPGATTLAFTHSLSIGMAPGVNRHRKMRCGEECETKGRKEEMFNRSKQLTQMSSVEM